MRFIRRHLARLNLRKTQQPPLNPNPCELYIEPKKLPDTDIITVRDALRDLDKDYDRAKSAIESIPGVYELRGQFLYVEKGFLEKLKDIPRSNPTNEPDAPFGRLFDRKTVHMVVGYPPPKYNIFWVA